MQNFYGGVAPFDNHPDGLFKEELQRTGFFLAEGVLSSESCQLLQKSSEALLLNSLNTYGKEHLETKGELNQIRTPFLQDHIFFDLILREHAIIEKVEKFFKASGSFYRLNQQNLVCCEPSLNHNQAKWHRDLPYLPIAGNQPFAISVLVYITDSDGLNGGTHVVPYSHLSVELPSWEFINKHEIQVEARAGSVLFFNSQLLHRSGFNKSNKNRYAINNVFTNPVIQQQINLSKVITDEFISKNNLNSTELQLLGMTSAPADNYKQFFDSKN